MMSSEDRNKQYKETSECIWKITEDIQCYSRNTKAECIHKAT